MEIFETNKKNFSLTKEEIIELIDNRIKSEFRKHKNINWSKIAAQKIFGSLENFFNLNKKQ